MPAPHTGTWCTGHPVLFRDLDAALAGLRKPMPAV